MERKKSMDNERKETEFAYIFARLMGLLEHPDSEKYLKAREIEEQDIVLLKAILNKIAFKAFFQE